MWKKIGRFLLVVFILCLLGLASTFITLFFMWPWWAGLIIFFGVIFSYEFSKFIYRKYRQSQLFKKREAGKEVQHQTKHVRQQFLQTLRSARRVETEDHNGLPWLLMLGSLGSGKTSSVIRARVQTPMSSVDPNQPVPQDDAFKHMLLESSVVVDVPGAIFEQEGENNANAKRDWDMWLSLFKRNYHNVNFKSTIVSISIEQLLGTPDEVKQYAKLVRHHLDLVSEAVGYVHPVYIMVTKSDMIHGFTEFARSLPVDLRLQPFGHVANTSGEVSRYNEIVDEAFRTLEARITCLSLVLLSSGGFFDTSLMLLAQELRQYQQPLLVFISNLFKDYFYSEQPLFRGLFFVSSEQMDVVPPSLTFGPINDLPTVPFRHQVGTEGLFLHGLFKHVFPQDKALPRRIAYLEHQRRTRVNVAYGIWWSAWLVGAVYLGLSYQNAVRELSGIQHSAKVRQNQFTGQLPQNLLVIDQDYHDILTLQDIRSHWQFSVWPFSGGVDKILRAFKARYVANFQYFVLTYLDKEMERALANHNVKYPSKQIGFYIQNLIARITLLQARLNGQSVADIDALPAPVMYNLDLDNINKKGPFGVLYKAYINWSSNIVKMRETRGKLMNLVDTLQIYDTSFTWLTDWANSQPTIKSVSIVDFWPSAYLMSSKNKIMVPAAFTDEGAKAINGMLLNLRNIQPNPARFDKYELRFKIWYELHREQAWRSFLQHFPTGLTTVSTPADWFVLLQLPQGQTPYFKLLERINKEFSAYKVIRLPEWIQIIQKMHQYYAAAALRLEVKGSTTADYLDRIEDLAKSVESKLRFEPRKKESEDTKLVATEVVSQFSNYLKTLQDLSKKLQSVDDAASYDMAKTLFEQDSGSGAKSKESLFFKAYTDYRMVRYFISQRYSFHEQADDIWSLLRGSLDYYVQDVIRRTACFIDQSWHAEVLNKTVQATTFAKTEDYLFGAKGVVTSFINKNIAPFVEYTKNGYVPKQVMGHELKLNANFYELLNTYQKMKRLSQEEAQLNKTISEEKYVITVKTYPTNVNKVAKVLPVRTVLTTACGTSQYNLESYNYITSSVLPWKLKGCGETTLSIDFGTFTLKKTYDDFLSFVRAFQSGEVVYEPTDFPDSADQMESYGLHSVSVQYDIQGIEPLYPQINQLVDIQGELKQSLLKFNNQFNLPMTITRCSGGEN